MSNICRELNKKIIHAHIFLKRFYERTKSEYREDHDYYQNVYQDHERSTEKRMTTNMNQIQVDVSSNSHCHSAALSVSVGLGLGQLFRPDPACRVPLGQPYAPTLANPLRPLPYPTVANPETSLI